MYFSKETERICKGLYIAAIIVLVAGFVGGIMFGLAFRVPETKIDYTYSTYGREVEYMAWTFNSTVAMLSVWISATMGALLIYTKKLHLELIDKICGSVVKTEKEEKIISARNLQEAPKSDNLEENKIEVNTEI